MTSKEYIEKSLFWLNMPNPDRGTLAYAQTFATLAVAAAQIEKNEMDLCFCNVLQTREILDTK